MKRRTLSDEEKQMWESITQGDARLDPGVRSRGSGVGGQGSGVGKTMGVQPQALHFSSPTPDPRPLTPGSYAGIDRNTADRFRKGELVLDGVIDMHGMTREKAHIALVAFIREHYERGSRCLLAITGKGASGHGVLRDLLPGWLAEPRLRAMVLALDAAKPKHGGSGAYYILLRRKRHG